MSESSEAVEKSAAAAVADPKKMTNLAESLSGDSRRTRQQSSAALAIAAKQDPQAVAAHVDALVDALNRPEAQTRWECLDALTEIVAIDTRSCDKAMNGAEAALFDEDSGTVRLAAMRFLCKLGATTENRSEKVWLLLDEAIQCYHGDLEFQDMLVAVIGFSAGKLAPDVKAALADRMRFDAESGKGVLRKRAAQIVQNLK